MWARSVEGGLGWGCGGRQTSPAAVSGLAYRGLLEERFCRQGDALPRFTRGETRIGGGFRAKTRFPPPPPPDGA
jgi:hypothetical protein